MASAELTCEGVSVAHSLSSGFSRGRLEFDITAEQPLQIARRSFFFLRFLWFFQDYKRKVPAHNSFKSVGTLKNPHTIHKE